MVTKRLLAGIAVLLAGVGVVLWAGRGQAPGPPARAPEEVAWAALDPQARCHEALSLVTAPDRWPILCRWRTPGGALSGQAFPPPKGPPPYDDPHVEIYVAPDQTREQLASAIAHELGHMHHTREPTFVADWLAARNLPEGTSDEVWTEDYAEVFAALFGPPSPTWRAPTTRPTPEALAALRARFFA